MGGTLQKKQYFKLHSWIFNHPQVVKSPSTNGYVNIKYHPTGEVIYKKSNQKTPQ